MGVKIFRIPSYNFLNGRLPFCISLCRLEGIEEKLAAEDISRIIIQTRLYTLSIMGMKFCSKTTYSLYYNRTWNKLCWYE